VKFLTRIHAGYCQMFSGAMALVLRLHGVPARIAVGFTEGEKPAKAGEPWVVMDRNAHAWVEVYFPGWGWIPFDPTPTRSLPLRASISYLQRDKSSNAIKEFADAFKGTGAYRSQSTPSSVAQQLGTSSRNTSNDARLARNKGIGPNGLVPNRGGGGQTVVAKPTHHRSFLAWVLVAAAAALALLRLAKIGLVRWRYVRQGPRAQASAAYHDLATWVADQGLATERGMTFEELAGEVQRTLGVDASAFAASATEARYAPPAQAGHATRTMRHELRRVKRSLRSQLSLRDRLTGSLRLRAALAQLSSDD
jgi:hypothetical protein